jgi:hypothetical protein
MLTPIFPPLSIILLAGEHRFDVPLLLAEAYPGQLVHRRLGEFGADKSVGAADTSVRATSTDENL